MVKFCVNEADRTISYQSVEYAILIALGHESFSEFLSPFFLSSR